MAKKRTKAQKAISESTVSTVSTGEIRLPERQSKDLSPGLGVDQSSFGKDSPLKTNAQYAAAQSTLFPKGGEAFERWCSSKGISARERRSLDAWSALLAEFAARPIHGLRRGPAGGTHRANKRDLRR